MKSSMVSKGYDIPEHVSNVRFLAIWVLFVFEVD